MNEEIRVPQVRLIDQDGEMIGVMSAREAIQRAYSVGLDLLEISPNADPPVCKILDFGKFKYEQQKKKNEAKKRQKVIEIKEVKVRPNIDENDYQVKLDTSNQKINAKIREHSLQHVPVIAVVGRKEAEQRTVALRRLGGDAQEVLPLEEAVARLAAEATAPDLVRGAA